MPLDALLENFREARNQLPLYYLLVRPWISVGKSEFVLRFFSTLWATISIPLIARLGYRLGGARVAVLAAFMLAVSPFHIWYAQEARTYTLLVAVMIVAHNNSTAFWVT